MSRTKKTYRIPERLLAALERYAEDHGQTLTGVVCEAIAEYLRRRGYWKTGDDDE